MSAHTRRSALVVLTVAMVIVGASCTLPGSPTTPTVPTTGSLDLAPAALTYTEDYVVDGGTISTTLALKNLGSAAYTGSITIDYYVATTSTFDPATDTAAGSTTVSGIGANTSTNVNYTLTMPNIVLASDDYNVVYVYADVDPSGTTGDSTTSNNVSTAANAAVVLVYTGSPATYSLEFDSYNPQTGGTGNNAGPANTALVLYQDNGTGNPISAVSGAFSNNPSTNFYGNFTASLSAGTYYLLVYIYDAGPYALNVRATYINLVTFANLSSPPTTANETPYITPYTAIQTYNGPPPTGPYPIKIGNAVNWYGSTSGDCQWFTFTLP